jgi:hypothetical protein
MGSALFDSPDTYWQGNGELLHPEDGKSNYFRNFVPKNRQVRTMHVQSV